LDRSLVKRAKNRGLNLERVTEKALSSILEYFEYKNGKSSSDLSLISGSLFKRESELMVPRAGFEHTIIGDITHANPFFSFWRLLKLVSSNVEVSGF